MFQWINFRSEPKKTTIKHQAFQFCNVFFRKFFNTGSWLVYILALLFLIIGVAYIFVDESRKRNLLERRREIRRRHERPPQKRRPGAAARNHEIYRTVMGKIKEYIEPDINHTCVFRQTSTGTIYGQVVDANESRIRGQTTEEKEDKESETEAEYYDAQRVILY